jgi:CubicO group peptidase (beta-lactamase class C family)
MARFEALAPSADMGQGFGLGFAVRTDTGRNPLPGSNGDYFWGGAYGTYFWIDPKEALVGLYMAYSPKPESRIQTLNRAERVAELGRMLGGGAAAQRHAQELLSQPSSRPAS